MAEPTTTRVILRREIARDLGMPFFRRFPSGITVQDTATSGLSSPSDSEGIRDSRLSQPREYWKNSWIFETTQLEQRKITDFLRDLKKLVVEYPFSSAPSTAATIEIFNIHTPEEIHLAINDAIQDAFPAFFDIVTSESMVIEEDKLEYELVTNNSDGRAVLTSPYRIKNVWIERTGTGETHLATTGDTLSISDTLADFSTDIDTAWSCSIYAGTGAGQYATVSALDTAADKISVTGGWLVAPDNTSKFRLWERKAELYAWDPYTALEFDAKDYPNRMRMLFRMPDKVGLRFRIQYVGEPQVLATEAATTVVPKTYIKHAAIGKLLAQRARSKPGESDKYVALAQQESAMADKFKSENAFDLPDQTLWTEEHYGIIPQGGFFEIDNPMDW